MLPDEDFDDVRDPPEREGSKQAWELDLHIDPREELLMDECRGLIVDCIGFVAEGNLLTELELLRRFVSDRAKEVVEKLSLDACLPSRGVKIFPYFCSQSAFCSDEH